MSSASKSLTRCDVCMAVEDADDVTVGSTVAIVVHLEREGAAAKVHAPFYPTFKDEGWWLLIGNANTNELFSIKRVSVGETAKVRLEFDAPDTVGEQEYTLYLMCDSYLGCDQEYEISVDVKQDSDSDSEDNQSEEGGGEEGAKRKKDADASEDEGEGSAKRAKN